MAFELKNFGSEVANAKAILGGIRYFRYHNDAGDTITTAGFFPSNLGLKKYDRICVIPANAAFQDSWYYVSDDTNGVITVSAF